MPAALLVWITCLLFLENINDDQTFRSRTTNVIVVAIVLYVCALLNLSMLPVGLLCLYALYSRRKSAWTYGYRLDLDSLF